jgi:hypothetical protein
MLAMGNVWDRCLGVSCLTGNGYETSDYETYLEKSIYDMGNSVPISDSRDSFQCLLGFFALLLAGFESHALLGHLSVYTYGVLSVRLYM